MIKSHLVKNAFTIWLRCAVKTLILEIRHKRNKLRLGHMTNISNCEFGMYNTIYDHVIMIDVKLGDFTYVAAGSIISNAKIGKFCSIGPDIKCGLAFHPNQIFVSTHPVFYSMEKQSQITFADKSYFDEYKDIRIGNDVWIGANVIIVGEIEIGDGAIIATGSIVTKSVPPYAIVAGVPAKVIRYRFVDSDIKFMLNLKWWNLDIKWIKENFKLFHNISFLKEKLADGIDVD
jgi:acetyltransferase-like isoleucine patch superfamily enzyme